MRNRNKILSIAIMSLCFANSQSIAASASKKVTATPAPTKSSQSLGIAAVVGDKAISSFDVDSRIKFIVATTKISDSPEVLKNIRPQVIRALINESLQLQEAEKNGITIPYTEIRQAIASIETQREMPIGGIAAMLKANNVPEKTYLDQVRSQLSWNKLITKNVRSRIRISDEEIALAKTRIASPIATAKEVEIAVINLPIEKKGREAEIRKTSEKLVTELRKGVKFEDVAQQFSSSSDGKSFWIRPEQLDPIIANAIKTLKVGSVSGVIHTANGFSIIKLANIRAAKAEDETPDFDIKLKEILLKLKDPSDEKEADILLKISEAVAKDAGNCEDSTVASIKDLDTFNIEVNFAKTSLSSLAPAIKTIAENLKIGEMSSPFASEEGIRMYMLCAKKPINGLSNDKIRDIIFRQKIELEAQKYLRNLERANFVEVRE